MVPNHNSKNISMEAMRFIFMLIIIFWHFGRINPFTHGYIAVDFFFILSGYFIYKSYTKRRLPVLEYTCNKIKKFYFKYLIVFIIAFILKIPIWIRENVLQNVLNTIPEILMIHGIGIFGGNINPPTWYLSVLIVGGGLLYSLLWINKNTALTLFLPAVVIFSYTCLFANSPSLEQFSVSGFISEPLLRGCAGMSLGVLLSAVLTSFSNQLISKIHLVNVLTIISVVVISVVLCADEDYDKFAILAFSILIVSCSIPGSLINKLFNARVWGVLGGVTYEMLLVHAPVIWVLSRLTRGMQLYLWGEILLGLVYWAIVMFAAFSLRYIDECRNRMKNEKNKN